MGDIEKRRLQKKDFLVEVRRKWVTNKKEWIIEQRRKGERVSWKRIRMKGKRVFDIDIDEACRISHAPNAPDYEFIICVI